MTFDNDAPFCDKILYSDLWRLRSDSDRVAMVARRVVFITEFETPSGAELSGDVIARTFKDARRIVFGRGLGERIVRRLEPGDYAPASAGG